MTKKPTLYVLVGPPAIGKSTWIKNNISDANIVSRDFFCSEVGDEHGLSYDEMFTDKRSGKLQKIVNRRLDDRYHDLLADAEDMVIDMTNMSANSRKYWLDSCGEDYHKIAVVFDFIGKEELVKKNTNKRAKELEKEGIYKTIPDEVFDKMVSSYEIPSKEEGFDEITYVNTLQYIK